MEKFLVLNENQAFTLTRALLPPAMQNHSDDVVSVGNLCRWLTERAAALGTESDAGFAATEVLYDDYGAAGGIARHLAVLYPGSAFLAA